MTAAQTTETQMVGLVRNALMVAGQEMGAQGDHWPVINATIHSIMKDLEQVQITRNVREEMRTHLYEQLVIMDKAIVNCTAEVQQNIIPKLKRLRELYDAYFTDLNEGAAAVSEDEIPVYIQRAKAIIQTLEGDNE